MKILHLSLKKQWFDMYVAGIKKEEYRDLTPYWAKRLLLQMFGWDYNLTKEMIKQFDAVKFTLGYAKNAQNITFQWKGLEIGTGNPEWGANGESFIIKLGEIININGVHFPTSAERQAEYDRQRLEPYH